MGRHAAPEPYDATVQFAIPAQTRGGQREIDLGAWWRRTDSDTRVWTIMGAAAAVAVGVGAIVSASSGHTSSTDPTWSARTQGWSYGAELRDQGYNSMTVMGRCDINDGGYGGSYWSDYLDGCAAVALQMDAIQSGR